MIRFQVAYETGYSGLIIFILALLLFTQVTDDSVYCDGVCEYTGSRASSDPLYPDFDSFVFPYTKVATESFGLTVEECAALCVAGGLDKDGNAVACLSFAFMESAYTTHCKRYKIQHPSALGTVSGTSNGASGVGNPASCYNFNDASAASSSGAPAASPSSSSSAAAAAAWTCTDDRGCTDATGCNDSCSMPNDGFCDDGRATLILIVIHKNLSQY